MESAWIKKILFFVWTLLLTVVSIFAQVNDQGYSASQEVSETDGIPVIVKHLPDWENVRNDAVFIPNKEKMTAIFGERPIFDSIDFIAGTEAAAALYPEGKLLIVEYSSPQASGEADGKIKQKLAESAPNPPVFYRRIGNYNVFLFDGTDESAANALFDQIKYEKVVQWLDKDPTLLQRAERAFIQTYTGIFVGTVFFIVLGLGLSILAGIAVGLVFFRIREQKRATMSKFSDAGGLTRLNLDDLTQDITPGKLLKD